jgi:hypothetical protein
LEQVPIAGHDVDATVGDGRIRPDDVVRLVLRYPDRRDAQTHECGFDQRDLLLEGIGHLLLVAGGHPVLLVRTDQVHTPLGSPIGVPTGHHGPRPVLADQAREHVQQARGRIGRRGIGGSAGVRHAVEGTEVQRCGIQQHERSGHRQ